MKDEKFWEIIRRFNNLMKSAISGPDCTDPSICHGNCCGIQIDIPKILAEKYIELGYAREEDFIRSNIFTFKLRFELKTAKCFLFDPVKNGCSVHHTEIKPPQCWIYPTNFLNKNENISCKMIDGWRIVNFKKTQEAKELLDEYNEFCSNEAKMEIKKITNRIENSLNSSKNKNLINQIMQYKPSELGGFQDSWNSIIPLSAEGISLQMKKFCEKNKPECTYLPDNFLECKQICEDIANYLIKFFEQHIYEFIKQFGADSSGNYPLYRILSF